MRHPDRRRRTIAEEATRPASTSARRRDRRRGLRSSAEARGIRFLKPGLSGDMKITKGSKASTRRPMWPCLPGRGAQEDTIATTPVPSFLDTTPASTTMSHSSPIPDPTPDSLPPSSPSTIPLAPVNPPSTSRPSTTPPPAHPISLRHTCSHPAVLRIKSQVVIRLTSPDPVSLVHRYLKRHRLTAEAALVGRAPHESQLLSASSRNHNRPIHAILAFYSTCTFPRTPSGGQPTQRRVMNYPSCPTFAEVV